MNDRSGDDTGSFKVEMRLNGAKFTNMIVARFRVRWHSFIILGPFQYSGNGIQ